MLAVTTATLAVLTVGIHFGWTERLYTSWPLITLWTITAASAVSMLFSGRVYRRPVVFGLHLALAVILGGACVTHFCSVSGSLHLRLEEPPVKESASGDTGTALVLPQGVAMESFEIVTYPATNTPRDYRCTLLSENGASTVVSMNRPGRLMGYTFILSSYDDDGMGMTFTVSHDPWGMGLTYAGYTMLALSLIAYFFAKGTLWRASLKKLALPVLLLATLPLGAKEKEGVAEGFGRVLVYYNGRVCPVSTVAKDFMTNLTGGSASYGEYSMEDVLNGFVFDFSSWRREPAIRIKNKELRQLFSADGGSVSYEQLFGAVTGGQIDVNTPQKKYSADMDRFEAVNMLASGEILKIFPIKDDKGNIVWLSPTDNIPSYIEGDQWLFIRKYLGLLNEQVQRGNTEGQQQLLDALKRYQLKILGDGAPSDLKVRTEMAYNRFSALRWPPICIGMVGMALFLAGVFCRRRNRILEIFGSVFAATTLALLTCMTVMRWIVCGHVPLSNGYETMQFLAWILLVIAVVFSRNRLVNASGILAAGLAVGVSVMNGSGASITGLMPVLDSPLLSIHVLLVMCSYALFLLMALTGIAGLLGRREDDEKTAALLNVMLYPALALLALGIFAGAVWANVSWGRYWGWDPKEVWALITLLIYSFAAHPCQMPLFGNPRVLMRFSAIAFVSVLITYFGVNFVLGGLHSYA